MFGDENKEQGDIVSKKLFSLAQYVLLGATGILPIFFLPTFVVPLGYTKIALLSTGLFLALMFFAFAVLRRGSITIQAPVPLIMLWGVAAIAVISALFSGDFKDAFWGTEVTQHTAVFVVLLALTLSLWHLIGARKDMIIHLYLMFAGSAIVLALFHLLRIVFGADFLTLGIFGGNLVLSPFGEWNSLAIFYGLVVIFSLVALEQLSLSNGGRYFFAGVIGISLLMLSVINFVAVFVVLALVGLVMIVYALTKGNFRFVSSQVVPTKTQASTVSIVSAFATLLVSLIFLIGGSAAGGAVSTLTGISHIEVRPSLAATIDIGKSVYAEDLFLGVGPNRFVDAWRLHRDPSINTTIFWNTNFEAGYGYIPTVFITMGLLGGLFWIVFLGVYLYVGVRTLLKNTPVDHLWYFIALSSFVASVYLWFMSILYVSSPVLLLLASVCSGIFLASRRVMHSEATYTYAFMQNQKTAFIAIAITVLVVVSSVGSVYYMGRHVTALALFREGIIEFQNGGGEQAMNQVIRALAFSGDDLFLSQIAAYKRDRVVEISNGEANDVTRALLQKTYGESLAAADAAIAADPTNPENHAVLGRLQATVMSINPETYTLARNSLVKAQELDPKNPARFVALAELELLQGKTAEAREFINRAIALKSNYTDAFFILAQVEIADGNVDAALTSTKATVELDPNNPVRHFQLGVLESAKNNVTAAALAFETAVKLNTDYSNARYFLAFAYDALGRKQEAISELEQVLVRNPGNAEVERLLATLRSGASIVEVSSQRGKETVSIPATDPLPEPGEASAPEPVTADRAPETDLLSPVNADTITEEVRE